MKKYIILLLATTFLLGTSVSSCTNFLEEKPESEFDEGTFYKTVESLKVGAVGAFSTLRYMYNVGTNTPLFVGMVGTDECMYPNETNLRGFIDRYTYTPTDGCIKQFWFRYYRLITACIFSSEAASSFFAIRTIPVAEANCSRQPLFPQLQDSVS